MGLTTKPLPVSSNTVPAPFSPPSSVVPNRLPAASAIKPATGFAPSAQLASAQKLTSGVRLAAGDWPGATATVARPTTANNDEAIQRIGVPSQGFPVDLPLSGTLWLPKIRIFRTRPASVGRLITSRRNLVPIVG